MTPEEPGGSPPRPTLVPVDWPSVLTQLEGDVLADVRLNVGVKVSAVRAVVWIRQVVGPADVGSLAADLPRV